MIVPYSAVVQTSDVYPSKSRHVEPGLNLGGPSPKAKYDLVSDSEKVARAKDEKNPGRGVKKNLKPYAYDLSKHCAARPCDGVPFA